MSENTRSALEGSPEIVVERYRGGHLVEQRHCDDPRAVAELVESWEVRPSTGGELIVVEPQPPEAIVALLREIADAIEQRRPLEMSGRLPHLRLQLATAGPDGARRSGRGELKLLWQEQSHPGG